MARAHGKLSEAQAFEIYYRSGQDRSLTLTSQKTGIRRSVLAEWCAKNEWVKKIQKRDEEIAKRIEKQNINDITEVKKRQLSLVRYVQKGYLRDLAERKITTSAGEAVSASRHELLLLGEATERLDVKMAIGVIMAAVTREVFDSCPHCHKPLEQRLRIAEALEEMAQSDSESAGSGGGGGESPASPGAEPPGLPPDGVESL